MGLTQSTVRLFLFSPMQRNSRRGTARVVASVVRHVVSMSSDVRVSCPPPVFIITYVSLIKFCSPVGTADAEIKPLPPLLPPSPLLPFPPPPLPLLPPIPPPPPLADERLSPGLGRNDIVPDRPSAKVAPVGCRLATVGLSKVSLSLCPKRWVCTAEAVCHPIWGMCSASGLRVARDWRTFRPW